MHATDPLFLLGSTIAIYEYIRFVFGESAVVGFLVGMSVMSIQIVLHYYIFYNVKINNNILK
jgi:hypothetical protein